MKESDESKELEAIFKAGDSWMTRYGIIGPIQHNSIILNLYAAFPKVKLVEYFLDQDEHKIEVILHLPTWTAIFTNKPKLIEEVIDFLQEYLQDYSISVKIKRFKKVP